MFTGLIEDVGTVESLEADADGARCGSPRARPREIALGDSIAVNGVCLTATEADGAGFATEAMNQTLEVTALGGIEAGARVNLELAMRADERLGGHIVQGHVDGVGDRRVRSTTTASPGASGSSSRPTRTSSTRARSPSTGSASRSRTWATLGLRSR